MNILKEIELIDLAIYTRNTLIITDLHIGYEESLNRRGVLLPRFQFAEMINRLENIFNKLQGKKIDTIIINGDLKHTFGKIYDEEWRNILKLFDFLSKHCRQILVIKGNHDPVLKPIADKRNVIVVSNVIIIPISKKTNKISKKSNLIINEIKEKNEINNSKKETNNLIINEVKEKNENVDLYGSVPKNSYLVMHGDVLPGKPLLKNISTIIIGHEHPAVSIKDNNRVEKYKAYIVGKYEKKNLIVQPSFNTVTEGTDVLKEKLLSPFLKNNSIEKFKAVIVGEEKLFGFGQLKTLI